jgi:tetratricopeptide (TPR) repeat protein
VDDAIRTYELLIQANPLGSSRGYMQLGLAHASIEDGPPRDLGRARREFTRALEVDPDSGAVLSLAEVAVLAGDWEEAEQRLGAADAGDPMSVAAPYLIGYLAWRAGDQERAWREFRRAVARGEVKKPSVKWTEEGDLKADPALRWRALARQTLTGSHWLRVREYVSAPGPRTMDMDGEYRRLEAALRVSRRTASARSGGTR